MFNTQLFSDVEAASADAVELVDECGGCGEELYAFWKCGVTTAADVFCDLQNCSWFEFPINITRGSGSSDGACATGLGFLAAAAAMGVAAL